jgi:transposase InsO family protein
VAGDRWHSLPGHATGWSTAYRSATIASGSPATAPSVPQAVTQNDIWVERSHRIDAEEFYQLLQGVVIDESGLFDERLREWEDHYNFTRPHGGLGGQTPYERLRQKTGITT